MLDSQTSALYLPSGRNAALRRTRKVTGTRCCWHLKPRGGESPAELYGKAAQVSRGRELPAEPPHQQGQPLLQHRAQRINTLFSLLRLRHFSLLKTDPSPQSPDSAKVTRRSDSSLKAANMIFIFFFQKWVILLTFPKKRMISRSAEQVLAVSPAHQLQLSPPHPPLIQQPQTQPNREPTTYY